MKLLVRAYNRKQKIKCRCGRKIRLSSRFRDFSGKRHAHCPDCRLEWHVLLTGYTYSHAY